MSRNLHSFLKNACKRLRLEVKVSFREQILLSVPLVIVSSDTLKIFQTQFFHKSSSQAYYRNVTARLS